MFVRIYLPVYVNYIRQCICVSGAQDWDSRNSLGNRQNKSIILAEYYSINEAKDNLNQFIAYEEKSGSDLIKDYNLGEEGFTVNDKYYKRLIVARHGKCIVVIMDITDELASLNLLSKIGTKIP